ncbi:hypothetical Protein YC6258_00054 [Gynuella sunshinyii YC6258]|uniref:Uncharacterized protein n=1 Tax=Gynuella sunshinyii YC6258 TaxID=1445510 RepID=A0A0C5UXS3_9GAMM|nr:hypothetical Protein YC6258_00054 [Gynuella sunshinyii YC6258]
MENYSRTFLHSGCFQPLFISLKMFLVEIYGSAYTDQHRTYFLS